jgi:hypothetical protein
MGTILMSKARKAWLTRILLVLGCLCHGLLASAADDAASLRDKHKKLTPQLEKNQFGRPLHMESAESPSTLTGDIYAVVDYPFAAVNRALNHPKQGPANWCDVMILHLNTKYCHASTSSEGDALSVNIGTKGEQELADAYRVQFGYRAAAATPEYFRVELTADSGPLSTKDYRIALEALALDPRRTFLHLSYSYRFGGAGRTATKIYLATKGSRKVGFTTTSASPSGQPEYIGGMRGVVERNTMRYYLAIDAYLSALSTAHDKRLEKRLTNWYDGTERYARQLHEVERKEYMRMKHKEYARQQTAQ